MRSRPDPCEHLRLTLSTLAGNRAIGGNGNWGIVVSGNGAGGGLFTGAQSLAALADSTISANQARGGVGGHGVEGAFASKSEPR
jgi:hypothetical protein